MTARRCHGKCMNFYSASVASLWTTAMHPAVASRRASHVPAPPVARSSRPWHDSAMKTITRRLLLAMLAVVLVVGGLAWVAGGELSAPEPRSIGGPPPALGGQDVTFPSGSGSQIHGWFARGEAGRGAVLLLHGVRGDRRDMLFRAEFLHAHRYSVLLIDFQAHGDSPGERITFGVRESQDVIAALVNLQRWVPGEPIGVIGVSMGAAAFVLAEHRPEVNAVVLESMYPTIEQAVADRLRLHVGPAGRVLAPLLTVQFRPRLGIGIDQLRPIDRIGSIGAPVFILSGTRDQHTSIGEARALFAAASEPKDFWPVEGAAHVSLYTYAKAEYERRLLSFLQTYMRRHG
jgi:uncharacterized protein